MKEDTAFNLLKQIVEGDTGKDVLWRLSQGQGTETEDGINWLRANAFVTAGGKIVSKEWDGEIRPEDFRVDTFSNKRGGFVLGLSSGVRITHIPTGLTAECDSDRSQHRNRNNAFDDLKEKLYSLWEGKQNGND